MTRFLFITDKPKGKFKWTQNPLHNIFLAHNEGGTRGEKLKVGEITHETFKIRLMVIKDDPNEDGNPNCPWKWVQLKQESKTLREAIDFILLRQNTILEKYKLYTQKR